MTTFTFRSLPTDGGTIAYELLGNGPLVVALPGMGDLRSSYRFLAPALVDAGYRVALVDLRGHGDSSTTFTEYGDEATARDTIALLEHLGAAVIIGNSMSAGVGVLVAAERPELVNGLVLVGPFVRNPEANGVLKAVMRVAMSAPLAAMTWKAYLPSLFAGRKPADFAEQTAKTIDAIRRPGYAKAFSLTTRLSHAGVEAVLDKVSTPTLVVMGELDPDFPKPAEEAAFIAERLDGTVLMVPDAGHYPQVQQPELVSPAIVEFLAGLPARGSDTAARA